IGVGLALLSAPLLSMIFFGQIALLVGCACFASLLLYLNNHKNISAILLAAAVLLKVNPVMLLATFVLFFNDWKYLLRFCIAFAGIVLLSLIFVSPKLYWDFFTQVLPNLAGLPPTDYTNQTPLRWLVNNKIPFFPNADQVIISRICGLYSFLGIIFLSGFAWWAGKRNQVMTNLIRTGTNNEDANFIAYCMYDERGAHCSRKKVRGCDRSCNRPRV
ncbi:MAG: glycosyltransferase family 87 protein, partial [bacterium]